MNGAHSTLAYLGSLRGRETVFDAINDPPLARFVEKSCGRIWAQAWVIRKASM